MYALFSLAFSFFDVVCFLFVFPRRALNPAFESFTDYVKVMILGRIFKVEHREVKKHKKYINFTVFERNPPLF